MANDQNLIPITKRTPREQKEISSKGGKASAEAKRRRKSMKEQAELLLSLSVQSPSAKEMMTKLGIEEDEQTNQMAILISMLNTSLDKKSKAKVQAATFLRDTSGNKPIDVVEVNKSTDESINKIDEYLCKKKKNSQQKTT